MLSDMWLPEPLKPVADEVVSVDMRVALELSFDDEDRASTGAAPTAAAVAVRPMQLGVPRASVYLRGRR